MIIPSRQRLVDTSHFILSLSFSRTQPFTVFFSICRIPFQRGIAFSISAFTSSQNSNKNLQKYKILLRSSQFFSLFSWLGWHCWSAHTVRCRYNMIIKLRIRWATFKTTKGMQEHIVDVHEKSLAYCISKTYHVSRTKCIMVAAVAAVCFVSSWVFAVSHYYYLFCKVFAPGWW